MTQASDCRDSHLHSVQGAYCIVVSIPLQQSEYCCREALFPGNYSGEGCKGVDEVESSVMRVEQFFVNLFVSPLTWAQLERVAFEKLDKR